jgi:hypothetical protein
MTKRIQAMTFTWACILFVFVFVGPPGMDGFLPHELTVFPSGVTGVLTAVFVLWALSTPVMVLLWVVCFFRWAFSEPKPPAAK